MARFGPTFLQPVFVHKGPPEPQTLVCMAFFFGLTDHLISGVRSQVLYVQIIVNNALSKVLFALQ